MGVEGKGRWVLESDRTVEIVLERMSLRLSWEKVNRQDFRVLRQGNLSNIIAASCQVTRLKSAELDSGELKPQNSKRTLQPVEHRIDHPTEPKTPKFALRLQNKRLSQPSSLNLTKLTSPGRPLPFTYVIRREDKTDLDLTLDHIEQTEGQREWTVEKSLDAGKAKWGKFKKKHDWELKTIFD
jgi:hypothetical protein